MPQGRAGQGRAIFALEDFGSVRRELPFTQKLVVHLERLFLGVHLRWGKYIFSHFWDCFKRGGNSLKNCALKNLTFWRRLWSVSALGGGMWPHGNGWMDTK